MDYRSILATLTARKSLTAAESEAVFGEMIAGSLTPCQVGALLGAFATKGESSDEILGAVRVMRSKAVPLPLTGLDVVDTCGTGGDAHHTFNISTAAALIAAGAAASVAKHGNRAMSGLVGAADVLEGLGVRIDLTPAGVARCIQEVGIGFLFAPTFHPAMKNVAALRREIGIRTIFNLLGPLSSPAGARRQVIGVYARPWLEPIAKVLNELGSTHVMVVHSEDGMDELSLAAPTNVAELRDGSVRSYSIDAAEFGLPRYAIADIQVADREQAIAAIRSVLDGEPGPFLEIALFNAGAAIYVAGRADTLHEGIQRGREAVLSGAARQKLSRLIEVSNS